MSKKPVDLAEILPPELREMEAEELDKFIDTPLVFIGARDLTGNNGAYKRISVSLVGKEDVFILSTGASQPMAVLDWADKNNQFPFIAKFVRAGRAILLKGAG